MNFVYIVLVVSAWCSNPILRRAFIDRAGDSADGKMGFVLWNSIACSIIALVSVCVNKTKLPSTSDVPLVCMVVGTATMAVASNYFMNIMMSDDNPGKIVCVVGGLNNIAVYIVGSLMYGQLNVKGVTGVFLCSAGIFLMTDAKVPTDAIPK